MRRRFPLHLVRDVLLCATCALVLVCTSPDAVRAPGAARMQINGAYDLVGSGPNTIEGKAIVNPGRVRITMATMTDQSGNTHAFEADLTLDRSTYRFYGTGTLGAATAKVSGRFDPDDQTVKKFRIVGTVVSADGKAGRFAGAHR